MSDGTTDHRLSVLGDAGIHWMTTRKRPHGTSHAVVLHKAVAWIVSLARQEGSEKVRRRLQEHRDLTISSFCLTSKSFDLALESPDQYAQVWKEQLRLHCQRACDQRKMRAWRAKLFTAKARPTKTLFRWLRSIPPTNNMCLKSSDRIVCGPCCFLS